MAQTSNDDCYFYYYSSCAKGNACPFRHEPAALAQEVTCRYWKLGQCTNKKCIFRHMDTSATNRKVTPCFYETQPGGCRKPHCPFLHEKPKDPYPSELTEILEKPSHQKILVNPNKIGQLGNLILPVQPQHSVEVQPPPISARGSAKLRLGPKPSIRDRLGLNVESVEVFEEDSEEENSEEEALRKSAIQSLDLRSRLPKRMDEKLFFRVENDYMSDEEEEDVDYEEERVIKSVVVRKVASDNNSDEGESQKLSKRVKPKKVKKSKKVKKEKKKKSSRSKKEDLGEPDHQRVVSVLRSDEENSTDSETSLEDRIANRRDLKEQEEDGQNVAKRKRRSKDKYDSNDQDQVPKKRKKSVTEKEELLSTKMRRKKKSSNGKETSKKDLNEVEKFLKDNPDVEAATNSSMDVMKELDELLKD